MILLLPVMVVVLVCSSCDDNSTGHVNEPTELNDAHLIAVLDEYLADAAGVLGIMQKIETAGYPPWNGAAGHFDTSLTRELVGSELFSIGSITKTFTATIVMQLYEEGQIALDSPLVRYLPQDYRDVLVAVPHGAIATVRQALSHRTGIYDYTHNWDHFLMPVFDDPAKAWTPMERLLIVRDYGTPSFIPGESFQYSNTNYLLLGVVIEHLEQQSFEQVLKERITDKIGLSETFYFGGVIGDGFENFAHGYDDEFGRKYDICEFNMTLACAEGGIISSTGDLVKFY
jgi:D-alanyl-D-alanine carboxypeptidase